MSAHPDGSLFPLAYSNIEICAEIQERFNILDKHPTGKMNKEKLQSALINLQGKSFSDEACRMMIAIFDTEKIGTISIEQFQHLYNYVKEWLVVFKSYDKDASGFINNDELFEALNQMGYKLSKNFVKLVFDNLNDKHMSFDQFIVLCIKIFRFTNAFRVRDTQLTGSITILYEDYIRFVLEEFL